MTKKIPGSLRTHERLMQMAANMSAAKYEKIDLNACLKEIRTVRGYTGEDISNVMSMSPQSYQNLENGSTRLKVYQMLRLCHFYDVSPNQFLGWRK